MKQIYGFAGRGERTLRSRFMPFLYEKTIVGSPTYNSLGSATDVLLHVQHSAMQLPLPARVHPTDFKEEIWLSLACVRVAPRPKGGKMGDSCS